MKSRCFRERAIDQRLGYAVIDDVEEADLFERLAQLEAELRARPRLSRQIPRQVEHGDVAAGRRVPPSVGGRSKWRVHRIAPVYTFGWAADPSRPRHGRYGATQAILIA